MPVRGMDTRWLVKRWRRPLVGKPLVPEVREETTQRGVELMVESLVADSRGELLTQPQETCVVMELS